LLSKDNYINAHTHGPGKDNTLSVINLYPENKGSIVPGKYYSVGIHPWYIPETGSGKLLNTLEKLARLEEVVAIGECGLDKLSSVPMDLQQFVFEKQVEIAENTGKPLIIHCVRAFNELVQVKNHTGSSVEWVIHGFNANLHVADMLIRHEMYFSFGKALANPGSNACKVLPQLDDELYLLETDDSAMDIEKVYSLASGLVGMDMDTLKLSMMTNFINIFKI
jgi:TatD DNase family protein